MVVEPTTQYITRKTGKGRCDFEVDNIIIEVAVREKGGEASKLLLRSNSSECSKLINRKHEHGILVLLDFSGEEIDSTKFDKYLAAQEIDEIKKALDQPLSHKEFLILYYFVNKEKQTECKKIKVDFS